jgi:hypothetical protein
MKISKRLAVIKRRFFVWLILKTQAPEYYGRLQSEIRRLERELEDLRSRYECARHNEGVYRGECQHLRARLRSLKDAQRARVIAG